MPLTLDIVTTLRILRKRLAEEEVPMRADLLKTVETCILTVVLVAVLTAGFYHAGMGAMIGLLVGLFIVLHLFRGITWNKGGHG